MPRIDVEHSFITENRSVYNFLNQPGQGLYIPLYQRDYSWDTDNIDQLLEDLTRGIERIAKGEVAGDEKEIRFLGTIITVIEGNKNNIQPIDQYAVPSRIEKIIDGQQRISTITLMSALLLKRLYEITNRVNASEELSKQVKEIFETWSKKLLTLFAFDLGRGTPTWKPKIIRGAIDFWTREQAIEDAYKSELSSYLASFLAAHFSATKQYPSVPRKGVEKTFIHQNGKQIEKWLNDVVSKAHLEGAEVDFPAAKDIIERFTEDMIWDYPRPELLSTLKTGNPLEIGSLGYVVCELVQTLSVCHYLLDRCCFTIIQPSDDDWAFDMFQSLNATGTPLTAIETFKPTVVNTVDNQGRFKGSDAELSFKKIENFLGNATTAQQKSKVTNDFLTSFFVALDGRPLSTHFSCQRKALNATFNAGCDLNEKVSFVKKLGAYAEFYGEWTKYTGLGNSYFPKIGTGADANLASMLILFLKASNHKMSITVLGRAFENILKASDTTSSDNAVKEYINAVKSVAAFYFIWRTASSNAGLDNSYRSFFKDLFETNTVFSIAKWVEHVDLALVNKEIETFEKWKEKAKRNLKYDLTAKTVIRLALLMCAHDTEADEDNKGLMKKTRNGVSPCLEIIHWISNDLGSIEHIAPQTNTSNVWDAALFEPQTEFYQSIGNLTLLPQDLNSSVGNKGWPEKRLYYQAVSTTDPSKLSSIGSDAESQGIELNQSTIELLKNSAYGKHLASIVTVLPEEGWKREIVEKRTDRILEIVWEKANLWRTCSAR